MADETMHHNGKSFKVGDRVTWVSSCLRKEGIVTAIVPPRTKPPIKGAGMSRDHESYIVCGGERGGRKADYWPRVSLLERSGELSAVEIAWCHAHADLIQRLITGETVNAYDAERKAGGNDHA